MSEWNAPDGLELSRFPRGSQTMGFFELADLFGITTEGLRKYESKGVIQPFRDENGYRRYCSWDLTKIIHIRQLRQEGISLSHIAAELEQQSPVQRIRNLDELRHTLTEEIIYREKLLAWVGAQRQELTDAAELGYGCTVQRVGRRYCCVYMVGDTLTAKEGRDWARLKEWIRALPFAWVCYVIGRTAADSLSCLCLEEEELVRYGLEHLEPDFVLPEGRCVVCNAVAEHSAATDTSQACLDSARARVEQLGMKLSGRPTMKMLWYTQRNGVFQSHNKALFPIEK